MNSISLPLPIRDGYLSSRIFNKPVVAIVVIAFAVIVALGIYLLKRSGYSLGFAPKFQRRTPDSPSPNRQMTLEPIVPQSRTPQQPPSFRERMDALPTPALVKGRYPDINVPFRDEDPTSKITVPGAVIDFAQQTNAHHIQLIVPGGKQLWLINCNHYGYFINGEGDIKNKVESPTPHSNARVSRQISLIELMDHALQQR